MKQSILFCFGLALTASVCIAAGDGPATKSRFQSQPVKRGSVPVVVSALGELQPEVSVEVGATVPGTIQALGMDPNDNNKLINFNSAVKEGTVLAQIDPAPYAAEVDRTKANLQRAKAEVRLAQAKANLAEKELLRIKKRQADKTADATDVEVATAAHEVARLGIVSAEAVVIQSLAALARAELNLSNTAIRSPIDGVVIERRCHVGQTVAAAFNAPEPVPYRQRPEKTSHLGLRPGVGHPRCRCRATGRVHRERLSGSDVQGPGGCRPAPAQRRPEQGKGRDGLYGDD